MTKTLTAEASLDGREHVAGGGRRDLDAVPGPPRDLLEEVEVGRLGRRDREHPADEEQRKHAVLRREVPRQEFHDRRVRDPRDVADERDPGGLGERLGDLRLGHEAEIDEDLPQETMIRLEILLLERTSEIGRFDPTASDERLPERGGPRRAHRRSFPGTGTAMRVGVDSHDASSLSGSSAPRSRPRRGSRVVREDG